jgi:hypothetical protein
VPLLPDGVNVEYENGDWQVVADRSVEVGHVHDERGIRGDVSDALPRSRKTCAQRNAQALPDRAEVRSKRPIVGAGTGYCLNGHHKGVTAVEHENAIAWI